MSEQFSYYCDLALVIDGTNSMTPVIGQVKSAAAGFHERMTVALADHGKRIDGLRVRVIVFRDLFDNGDRSIEATDFFELPGAQPEFARWVDSIKVLGNTTDTESGLAGLAVAINSPWTNAGSRRRHLTVLWTDAEAHLPESEAGRAPSGFASQVAASFDDLTDLWSSSQRMSSQAKRLVLFAPADGVWSTITEHWENVVHMPSQAGVGLKDYEWNDIMSIIAQSV